MWQLNGEKSEFSTDLSLCSAKHSNSLSRRASSVALPDLVVLAMRLLERLVDLLEIVEWHKLTQFAESACQILRAVDDAVQVSDADFLRVDLAEHLSVALALNWH